MSRLHTHARTHAGTYTHTNTHTNTHTMNPDDHPRRLPVLSYQLHHANQTAFRYVLSVLEYNHQTVDDGNEEG